MLELLLRDRRPTSESVILDPGCGTGAFIASLLRWCQKKRQPLPYIVGVEQNPQRAAIARAHFRGCPRIEIRERDFLSDHRVAADFVVGNPPYVSITKLSEPEKAAFRRKFETARGRFDLYILFFERALWNLKPGGRLVFITPEKFLYVESAAALRQLLGRFRVEELRLLDEQTFGGLATYPTVSTITKLPPDGPTRVILRDASEVQVTLPNDGRSWLPAIRGTGKHQPREVTLEDVCERISCGVATGADSVFLLPPASLTEELRRFAYPTIAGRELGASASLPRPRLLMLVPYSRHGSLITEEALGKLGKFLSDPRRRALLTARTCVQRKPWYAFHETPRLATILRPKILCKDIARRPRFWIDAKGDLLPRHSVYYLVPCDPAMLSGLCQYLNSNDARRWLESHCQRAANGFLRLQSRVLKRLPLPPSLRPRPRLVGRVRRSAATDYSHQMRLPLSARSSE